MSDAYNLLKHIVYGATFEHVVQHNNRMVLTRAEVENYAEQSFEAVLEYLRTGNTTGKFSDFQCNIAQDCSRIFKTNKHGIVEFKRTDIGRIL